MRAVAIEETTRKTLPLAVESNERGVADFYDWFLSTCYGFMCYWMGREQ